MTSLLVILTVYRHKNGDKRPCCCAQNLWPYCVTEIRTSLSELHLELLMNCTYERVMISWTVMSWSCRLMNVTKAAGHPRYRPRRRRICWRSASCWDGIICQRDTWPDIQVTINFQQILRKRSAWCPVVAALSRYSMWCAVSIVELKCAVRMHRVTSQKLECRLMGKGVIVWCAHVWMRFATTARGDDRHRHRQIECRHFVFFRWMRSGYASPWCLTFSLMLVWRAPVSECK